MALKFIDIPADATSVKVGLNPSVSSGLVEIINDPDKNGAFKVTDKEGQKFRVVTTTPNGQTSKEYDLSGLILEAPVYTAEDLSDMTINQIKALAAELGYTITKSTKADIIAEFLEQQEG